jgi:hypothetical protein
VIFCNEAPPVFVHAKLLVAVWIVVLRNLFVLNPLHAQAISSPGLSCANTNVTRFRGQRLHSLISGANSELFVELVLHGELKGCHFSYSEIEILTENAGLCGNRSTLYYEVYDVRVNGARNNEKIRKKVFTRISSHKSVETFS